MSVVPDYCEPLVGYRSWHVSGDGELYAMNAGAVWPAKEPLVARCQAQRHDLDTLLDAMRKQAGSALAVGYASMLGCVPRDVESPVEHCSCGIYAHKDPDGEYMQEARSSGRAMAYGEVYLWGRVLDHALGYRAQYAYPKAITVNRESLVTAIEAKYGVPCKYEAPKVSDGATRGSVNYWTPPLSYSTSVYSTVATVAIDSDDDDATSSSYYLAQPSARAVHQQEQARLAATRPAPQGLFASLFGARS